MIEKILIFFIFLPLALFSSPKSGGNYFLTQNIIGSAGSNLLTGGNYSGDGVIGNAISMKLSDGNNVFEGGFFSHLVSTPANFGFSLVNVSSFSLSWQDIYNPGGSRYELRISTFSDLYHYLVYDSTSGYSDEFSNLTPNTSYYSFIFSNYMESDYSYFVSSVAVTLSAPVSSDTFVFKDIGDKYLSFEFPTPKNPGSSLASGWDSLGLPKRLYGLDSFLYSTTVYIAGGFDGVDYSSAVYYTHIYSDGGFDGFKIAGYLPYGVYGHKIFATKNRLYLIGGYNNSGVKNNVWGCLISTDGKISNCKAEQSLPSPLYLSAGGFYNNRIYIIGGFNGSAASSVYMGEVDLDGRIINWTSLNTLPSPRFASASVVISSYIFVLGGNDGANPASNVWRTQISSDGSINGWVSLNSLPVSLHSLSASAIGNKLFAIGGNNGSEAISEIFSSTLENGNITNWIYEKSLPYPNQLHNSLSAVGKLFIFGDYYNSVYYALRTGSIGTEYKIQISENPSFSPLKEESPWVGDTKWSFGSLLPNKTYYLRATSRNMAGVENPYSGWISTLTYSAPPLKGNWSNVGTSTLAANWFDNSNPPGTLYICEISTAIDFNTFISSQTLNLSATFYNLLSNTTYYGRVKSADILGRQNSAYSYLDPVITAFDPSLDVDSPTITVNYIESAIWKSSNSFYYDVDLFDPTPSAGLDKLTVKITTGPSQSGTVIVESSDVLSGINSQSYTQDWQIPDNVWNLIPCGTSYLSLTLIDKVGHSTSVIDAFYIMKDTTPPVISVTYNPPTEYLNQYPGSVSSATFSDTFSKLKKIYYSVSSNSGSGDGNVIKWTEIASVYGQEQASDISWNYDFNKLINGSNYFSIKAIDIADNETVLIDTFTIKKNVSGPIVSISTPSLTYLSTITYISGYNTESDSKAVMGTEISIKNKNTNLYWNGSGFLSVSQFWNVAIGTYPFVLNVNLSLVSGNQYEIVARSSDVAGNYSQVFATHTFTFDNTAPSAQVENPSNGASVYNLQKISGSADDSISSVSKVYLMIKKEGKSWNFSTSKFESGENFIEANGSSNWEYSLSDILKANLENGGTYYVTVKARDTSYPPNESNFYIQGSTFIYYDVIAPSAPYIASASSGTMPNAITLSCISPGDDGNSGYFLTANFYIDYSTYSEYNFNNNQYKKNISPSNLIAGSTVNIEVSGLSYDTTYYFAVWAMDDSGNKSEISNIYSFKTLSLMSNSIKGKITQSSGEGVQGIIVEAYGDDNQLKASDTTDAYGNYEISLLMPGIYSIKAIWSANDITSWISKSDIPSGSHDVNFVLNVSYQLASISGYVSFSQKGKIRANYSTQSLDLKEPSVEVYKYGRIVAKAKIDNNGRFLISNLLPGTYSVRVFNGVDYSEMSEIKLSEGQNFYFKPLWEVVNKNKVYAYPNPSKDDVKIYFETSLTDFDAEAVIFDITGKLVKKLGRDEVKNSGIGYEFNWNHKVENVASGVYIYILRIKDNSTGRSEKVIKKLAIVN